MLSFESDYIQGAHPAVLKALCDTNAEPLTAYGTDIYTERAKNKIRTACHCPEADVYFLMGGTQTNTVVISTMLHPYQGVIAATTGHIALHEAGAIEHTGHKVLEIEGREGKICAPVLENYLAAFYADENNSHMVQPGMVYISNPTEYGTLYSKEELTALHRICERYRIPLYLDGARLGFGLASPAADLTLADIARLCDVFYIGGTKIGALCGEALVFPKQNTPTCFVTQIKQHTALLAKGRLTGVQFDALFTDDLYFQISRHVIEMAEQLKTVLKNAGYTFFLETPTNQQFVLLEDSKLAKLKKEVATAFWEKPDATHTVVRFATGWGTRKEDIEALAALL